MLCRSRDRSGYHALSTLSAHLNTKSTRNVLSLSVGQWHKGSSVEEAAPTNPFDGDMRERLYDALEAADEPQPAATLADAHSLAELDAELERLLQVIQTYQDRYGVETLAEVDRAAETAKFADWPAARMELRRDDARADEHGREFGRSRVRSRLLHPGRPRDRRRRDEDVREPAGRAGARCGGAHR